MAAFSPVTKGVIAAVCFDSIRVHIIDPSESTAYVVYAATNMITIGLPVRLLNLPVEAPYQAPFLNRLCSFAMLLGRIFYILKLLFRIQVPAGGAFWEPVVLLPVQKRNKVQGCQMIK
jgi:hypothetical protein